MMFRWEPDMIRFMQDAAARTSYYKNIASLIKPFIGADYSVCDCGCGLGSLSIELARFTKDVYAADISKNALAVLAKNASPNITILEGDIKDSLKGKHFDGLVFCLFADGPEIIKLSKAHADKDIFVIQRNNKFHRFSVAEKKLDDGKTDLCSLLDEQNIPYTKSVHSFEFNQPFKSLEDAKLFFNIYSRDDDKSVITDEFVNSKIKETDDKEFPYIMEHFRDIKFVHIKTEEIKNV